MILFLSLFFSRSSLISHSLLYDEPFHRLFQQLCFWTVDNRTKMPFWISTLSFVLKAKFLGLCRFAMGVPCTYVFCRQNWVFRSFNFLAILAESLRFAFFTNVHIFHFTKIFLCNRSILADIWKDDVSFASFQNAAGLAWEGKPEKIADAQAVFLNRAKQCSEASQGKLDIDEFQKCMRIPDNSDGDWFFTTNENIWSLVRPHLNKT